MTKNLNGSFFTSKSLNGENELDINNLVAESASIDDLSCSQLEIGTLNVIAKFGSIDNSINLLEQSIDDLSGNKDFIDISCANIDVSLNANIADLTCTGTKNFTSGILNLGSTILNSNIVGNSKNISGLNKLTSSTGNIVDFSSTNLDISLKANINNLIATKGNIVDFSCGNLDVSLNTTFSNLLVNDLSTINLTSTDLSATNISSTDLSINTLGFAKQMGINVVNSESYATGNNVLRIAGHTNITNFVDDMTQTNTAQLVIGKVSDNQYIKFKTEKTGTGIGASSIDFENINADATGVDYLNFKNNGSSTGAYLYKDGRFRATQLDLQVEDNTGTYINFRDNVGDTAANDVGTIKSGVDGSEFPSAHFVDISFCGDYNAGNTEIFLSTDKNKASYIDVSNVGIATKTPTEKLEVNGNIKGSDLFITNGFCDTSFCIGSTADRVYQFEVFGNSKFAVNTNDSTYLEIGNLKSSSDTLQVNSFGNVNIICDANGNSSNRHISFKTNGRLGAGETELMVIQDDRCVKIGDIPNNDDALLYLNGNAGRNGALQIVSISDGNSKEIDGACFKPTNNGNNIINFQNTGGNDRGQIKGNGSSAVQYQTSSDRRLKTNIVDMSSQLQNIMDLIPCKYNWIEDNDEGYGFIAQEVHSVFPQMRDKFEETYCSNNPDFHSDCPCDASGKMFYYGLDYGTFTPYIIKAFQEFKIKTDISLNNLEARLSALEII
jgi:hypothetical protein